MPRCRWGCDVAGPLEEVEAHEAAVHGARLQRKQARGAVTLPFTPPAGEVSRYEFDRAARLARRTSEAKGILRLGRRKGGTVHGN